MKAWSTQKYSVSDVVNSTARVDVKHVSGPIRVSAAYAFATRLSGVTLLSGSTRSSTQGQAAQARASSRHFVTPLRPDGLRLQPGRAADRARPRATTWRSSRTSRDFEIFGVTGVATDLGEQTVRVPAGKFKAVVIRTTLSQAGLVVRQRHADELLRARQGARQARLPPQGRQRLDRRAGPLVTRCGAGWWRGVRGVLVSGCGGGESSQRSEVRAYLERTNAVQQRFAPDFQRAGAAFKAFANGEEVAGGRCRRSSAPRPTSAARQAAVAAVRPPARAATVHDRLLRVYAIDADLAHETLRLARYREQGPAALAGLDRASKRLRGKLRAARKPATQAHALTSFSAAVARTLQRLQALDVPVILAPSHARRSRAWRRRAGSPRGCATPSATATRGASPSCC